MREIKFRVWDTKENKFRETGFMINQYGSLMQYGEFEKMKKISRDRYKILQYTGLKDKNGKEIYEGDIVNQKYKLGNRYYLVKYDNTIASFVMKKLNKNNFESNKVGTETRFYTHDCKKSEVVGNKYENPELLGGE